MTSFTAVSTGNNTNASDINQLINALNGTTPCQVFLKSTANNAQAFDSILPSNPPGDQAIIRALVSGDTSIRAALYARSADTYGGLLGGSGSAITAHLYAGANGWNIPEQLAVAGAVQLNGGGTIYGNNILQGISTGRIFVQSTAPGSPLAGDIWIDTSQNLG